MNRELNGLSYSRMQSDKHRRKEGIENDTVNKLIDNFSNESSEDTETSE